MEIFNGLALGVLFAPQIGMLFGFADPKSLNDPYWNSPGVRAIEISAFLVTAAALGWMISGFAKLRVVRCEKAQ